MYMNNILFHKIISTKNIIYLQAKQKITEI